MQFISVDSIHLSYCYGTKIVNATSTSSTIETYIDDQTCKFYILKKFENSEMRYTDAMANFLVQDKLSRAELLSYIKTLLQTYQKEEALGLDKLRETLVENYEPKWTIPEEVKKDVPVIVVPTTEEKEKPKISQEEIERLLSQPSLRTKPKPKEKTNEEEAPHMTSFPAKAGNIESDAIIPKSQSDNSTDKEKSSSPSTSNTHDQTSQAHEQAVDDEHVVPKDKTNRYTNHSKNQILCNLNLTFVFLADSTKREVNENSTKSSNDQLIQPNAPIAFTDPISLPTTLFEHIAVSTITDLNLPTSTDESIPSNLFRPINNEADRKTGRQGEMLVFQYLQRKYPNETIVWVNENDETGRPYDIHMIIKSENNREEFIEVKTTRTFDQNTFPISIGEVEYLLKHSSNYFIYRVYYADHLASSTITVINKIKDNLQLKHLKLSMTVLSKSSD